MKRITAIVLSLLMCFAFTACDTDKADAGELQTYIFDVGKGDCILIRTKNTVTMIDTGYSSTAHDVKERLRSMNILSIDNMIITHYDKDHLGGAVKIMKDFRVDKVYLPSYESTSSRYEEFMQAIYQQELETERVSNKVSFTADSAVFSISASGCEYVTGTGGDEGNDNDMSLVISVENGSDSYLFAGDIEDEAIENYLSREGKHYDVLKIPHHGEMCDNTQLLLDAVAPKIAVITDGKGDKMDKKLKNLLESKSITYYSSKNNGDITIKSSGKGEYEAETEE